MRPAELDPWLDFAKLGAAGSFDSTFPSGQSIPAAVVAVRNFDYAMNDEELNQKKLHLIERIVYEHGMRIVLVSRIDPLQHLAGTFAVQTASPEPDPDASHKIPVQDSQRRWSTLLEGFETLVLLTPPRTTQKALRQHFEKQLAPEHDTYRRAKLAQLLTSECSVDERLAEIGQKLPVRDLNSSAEILAEIESRARAHYRWLWDGCSPAEQVLLYQIATYRFANPLAIEAGRELHRKGLITSDPVRWMMNRSFRRFVKSLPEPAAPVHPGEEPVWKSIERSAFFVLLVTALPLLLSVFRLSYRECSVDCRAAGIVG